MGEKSATRAEAEVGRQTAEAEELAACLRLAHRLSVHSFLVLSKFLQGSGVV